MAFSPSKWVIVDDTNSGIQYAGSWFSARGTLDNIGNFGPPFQSTLHGVDSNASLSYTFTGTHVIVYGSVDGAGNPSWECLIDGVSIGAKPSTSFPENNWVYCQDDSLSDGKHQITLKATVPTGTTFWFDRIQYVPSASVSIDNAVILVDSADPAIQYGTGWQDLRDIGKMTLQNSAKMTFDFVGVSLSWFSLIPGGTIPGAASSATYSIDGGTPTKFLLAGLATGAMEPYNQIFFQTPQLSAGKHHIEVVNGGNSGTTPLSLDYLVIQNAPVVTSSPSSGSSGGSGSSSSSSVSSSSSLLTSSTPSSSSSASSSSTSTQSPQTILPSGISSYVPAPSNPTSDAVTSQTGSSEGPQASSLNADSTSETSSKSSKPPIGATVGGVVGSIVVVIALVLFLLFYRRKKRKAREIEAYGSVDANSDVVEPFNVMPSTPASFSQQYTDAHSAFYNPFHDGGGGANITKAQPEFTPNRIGTPSRRNNVSTYSSVQSTPSPSAVNQDALPSSTSNLIMNSKAMDAMGPEYVSAPSGSVSSSPEDGASGPPRVMRHEDSGLRLPDQENNVLELPPLYTPG